MEKRIFLGILAATLIALTVAILLPGGRSVDQEPKLPWLIEINSEGNLSVFGVTLGHSSLAQAREQFQSQGKTSLFRTTDGRYLIEVFFQSLFLSGIKGDIVLEIGLPQAQAAEIFARGERISTLSSGVRKVELASQDKQQLAQERITSITFIPSADLDQALLVSRFGEPESRISEKGSSMVHWLYPGKGLDIAVNPEGKEVLQYINPADFDRLREPLQATR